MINQAEQGAIAATDYFVLFERPRHLVLDTATLEKDFYRLSRQWHPDRFARATSEEKQRSLEMTSQLNDAYRTLKDPIARTEYLLTIEGKPIERDKNADAKEIPADLLEEVERFVWRETSPGYEEVENFSSFDVFHDEIPGNTPP